MKNLYRILALLMSCTLACATPMRVLCSEAAPEGETSMAAVTEVLEPVPPTEEEPVELAEVTDETEEITEEIFEETSNGVDVQDYSVGEPEDDHVIEEEPEETVEEAEEKTADSEPSQAEEGNGEEAIAAVTKGHCGEGLTWEYRNQVLTIKGTGEMYGYDEEYQPEWFAYAEEIKELRVEKGITLIDGDAFLCLTKLEIIRFEGSEKAWEELECFIGDGKEAEDAIVKEKAEVFVSVTEYFFGEEDLESAEDPEVIEEEAGAEQPKKSTKSAVENLKITEQPEDVAVFAGDTVTLHVGTNRADAAYQWQWSLDGITWTNSTAAGSNTDTFSFTMEEEYDGVQVRCVVTGGAGMLISETAVLMLKVFEITKQPEDVTALAGDTVSLHVETNRADTAYQWQWRRYGYWWRDIAGSDTDTLSITMSETLDGMQYRCVVTSGAGTLISEVATVYCEGEGFEITEQPEDVAVFAGDTVTLHVGTNRADAAYQWQWSLDGITWTNSTAAGSNTDTFSFTMEEEYDGVQVRCVVTGGAGMLISETAVLMLKVFEITKQPEDVTALAGDTVSLHVETNRADTAYQWQWRRYGYWWRDIAGSDTDTLSITMSETLDGMQYRCVVTSGAGTLISEAATAYCEEEFEITKQPEDVTTQAGDTVSLHVETNRADTAYRWQWSRNGYRWWDITDITGSDTDTLSFEMNETLDGRQYRCVVTSGAGTLTSAAATVTCFMITEQPEDVTARAGDTVSLHVGTNIAEVTYRWQWSRDGDTWRNSTLPGSDTGTLSFTIRETYDGMQYRCVVTGGAGTVISEAAVVHCEVEDFEITEQPEDVTARAGDAVSLHVGTNKADTAYQWQSSRDGNTWRNSTLSGSDTDTLSFTIRETYDGIQYRCIVTCGEEQKTSEVAIITCFRITEQPEDVTARAGDTVSLHVGTNIAEVTYRWQWSRDGDTWRNSTLPGSDTGTLSFTIRETYDGMQYRCVVTGGAGTVTSEAAVVHCEVEDFEITEQPEDVTARAGDTVSLHVGTNKADTAYQWQSSRDGNTWRNSTLSGSDTDTLSFTIRETYDGIQYRCIVTCGEEQKTSEVAIITCFRITEQPEDVTARAGDTVSLHVGTNIAEVTYRWQWSRDGDTWRNSTLPGSDTGTLSFTIRETYDGMQYRCVVTGGAGTVTSEAAVIHCEVDLEITEQPEDVTALAGDTVSLHVGTNIAEVTYRWQWSSDGTTWTDCTSSGSDTDTLSFTMNETLSGMQYRCVVTGGAGTVTSEAAVVYCEVEDFEITEQPEDVTALAGDTVSLHVETNRADTAYQWQSSRSGNMWWNITSAGSDTDTLSFTMNETLDGRQYRCIVTCGEEQKTSEVAIITCFRITEQPEDVTARAGDTVSLHVGTNIAEVTYRWQWSRDGDTWRNSTLPGSDTGTLSFTIRETYDGMQYRCVVTGGAGTVTSEAAVIHCEVDLEITEQPEDVTARVGDTVSLHVGTNSAEVTYRWQWSSNGTTWTDITSAGSDTDTLSFTMRETYNGRQYRCIVTGGAGILTSEAAVLTITSQIVIDGVVYEMIDNEMTVTGYIGSADTVVVRETVDGHTVTVIGESAFEGSSIRSIDLPDTIEVIRKRAFANCSNLTSMY